MQRGLIRNHIKLLSNHLHELQEIILERLTTGKCVDCGETYLACLQFDHVRGEKAFAISNALRLKVSISKLLEELEKCEIRCGTCHTKRHGYDIPLYLKDEHIEHLLKQRARKFY